VPRRLVGHHDEGDAHVRRRRREELAKRRQTAGRGTDPDDGKASVDRARSDFRGGRVSPPRRRWLTLCCRPALGTPALQPGFPIWTHATLCRGRHPARSLAPHRPLLSMRRSIRSGVLRESLDASEDLSKQALRQVAVGKWPSASWRMKYRAWRNSRPGLEQPARLYFGPRSPSSGGGAGASARSASSRIWRRRPGSCSSVET